MKNISKILGLGILSLAALACTKESGQEKGSDELISIGAEVAETKAFLEGAFNANSTITVYDYLTPTSGTAGYHMEDVGVLYNGSDWSYVEDYPHRWEPGNHKFFGWMTKDGGMNMTAEDFFGDGFGLSGQTLNIPAKTMNASTDQFDFVYSLPYYRNYVKGAPGSADRVMLEMKHLFAAYFFSFSNNSPEPLELERVKLNIKSSASANINYSGSEPSINIAFQGTQPTIEKEYNSSVGSGKTIDVLNGNEITSSKDIPADYYCLIWPQDLKDASVEITFTAMVSIPYYKYNSKGGLYNVHSAEAVTGGAYRYNKAGYYEYVGKGKGTHNVIFRHDANGMYEEVIPQATAQEVSKSISLASVTNNGKWVGGYKYNYNLSFSNDFIDLNLVVMKWDGGHGGNITFE